MPDQVPVSRHSCPPHPPAPPPLNPKPLTLNPPPAVPADKAEGRDVFQCPVYATEARFRQEVFTAQLRTKQSWVK